LVNFCKESNENGGGILSSSDDVDENDEFGELSFDFFRGRPGVSAYMRKKCFFFKLVLLFLPVRLEC
jgi:hypothetical protein